MMRKILVVAKLQKSQCLQMSILSKKKNILLKLEKKQQEDLKLKEKQEKEDKQKFMRVSIIGIPNSGKR